ncbi:MAG: anion permease [Marinilabiliales bacterium]|nr:anion permease [Marinilabiliales bacterium]
MAALRDPHPGGRPPLASAASLGRRARGDAPAGPPPGHHRGDHPQAPPMGAVAVVGIAATAATGTLGVGQSLSGFGNPTIWLIVLAFFISRGFIKTGLGARVAYHFMAWLGRRTLGLGYGLVATDLVLAPAIPSQHGEGRRESSSPSSAPWQRPTRPPGGRHRPARGSVPHGGRLPGDGDHVGHVPPRPWRPIPGRGAGGGPGDHHHLGEVGDRRRGPGRVQPGAGALDPLPALPGGRGHEAGVAVAGNLRELGRMKGAGG